MPRDVVPMEIRSARPSDIFSTMRWNGKITCARLLMRKLRGRHRCPAASSDAHLLEQRAGSITTPLPITACIPGRRMPLGISLRTYFFSPIKTVWPALWPP